MHRWNEIDLPFVRAINLRLSLAKLHNWQDDIVTWTDAKIKEIARYEQMMTDIERDWNAYCTSTVQGFYDAASLCYLLLGGKMTGVDRDTEIARLVKVYYRVED